MPPPSEYEVRVAGAEDTCHLEAISSAIAREVEQGAAGMALRTPTTLRRRILAGDAVVATARDGSWAGFCYIAPWENARFVSTSALIVAAEHRGRGLARRLKEASLALAARRYPHAAPFGLSLSPAVARINDQLGFREVSYRELPADPTFWAGCETCPLHADLIANDGRRCHCRAVLRDPPSQPASPE